MDPTFATKVLGALIAIALGAASLTTPPLLAVPPLFAGALITAGLVALGVNIGATVAAGREAAILSANRRTGGR